MPNTFRGTRADITRLLADLNAALAGKSGDYGDLVRGVQLRMGVALLSKIQQAFIDKSRGLRADDGIQWPKLKRETIAQRRTTGPERKAAGVGGKRTRGLLTPAEDKRWRGIFGSTLARLRAKGVDEGEAKALAAKIAWSTLKSEGAKTKLDVFGGRTVDMLRDTGLLFRSLTPGVQDRPSGADGQIFETPPGAVIVGSNVKPWHHKGVPGRLPARPLWPEQIPEEWWKAIHAAGVRGLMVALKAVLTRGRP